MLSIEFARERAARGAALLDEHHEGWRERIDLKTLEIWNSDCCILGQSYDGRYEEGVGVLFGIWGDELSDEQFNKTAHHGFAAETGEDYAMLQRAWLELLEEK